MKLLELADAYAAFANGGKRVETVAILEVTDSEGKILEKWSSAGVGSKQVITPAEAFVISSILSDPRAREITFGPKVPLI